MIKIKIKNKNLLKESSEIKYSETAFNKIYKIYRENVLNNNPYVIQPVTAPIREFLFNNKKNILEGCVLFIKLTLDHYRTYENVEELKQNWDPNTNSFNKEYIDSVLNETQLKIEFNTAPLLPHYGDQASGYVEGKDNKIELWLLAMNPPPPPGAVEVPQMRTYVNWDHLKSTIKHELQHVAQIVNSICINYSQELAKEIKMYKNPKDMDFIAIPRLSLNSTKYFAGSGKTISRKSYDVRKDGFEKYLQNTEEYKPHLTNILDDIVKTLFKEKFITKKHLTLARIKEAPIKERLKYIKDRVKEQPDLFNKDMFMYMISNARTFDGLAKHFLQPIIQEKKPILYLNMPRSNQKIEIFLKNKNEFRNDLYVGLVKRLRDQANKIDLKNYTVDTGISV